MSIRLVPRSAGALAGARRLSDPSLRIRPRRATIARVAAVAEAARRSDRSAGPDVVAAA